MYFVGIDFGHGETTVSRVPGYNGAPVSQIAIKPANNNEGKKIVSAVCRRDNQWSLVYGEQDYRLEDIREGFKGRISQMSKRDKESMREFAKLIFATILKNDTDLKYKSPDDKNFDLGIACPSDWDANSQQEYLNFFRIECGLPVDHCIKESDAAFFTKFGGYAYNDKVFVIDLGSSTIDFTTYSESKCISKCCWGANQGAHMIEDALMPHIYGFAKNRENVARLKQFKANNGLIDNVEAAISLFVRSAKEKFYTENRASFKLRIEYQELTERWPDSSWELCIVYEVSKDEFNRIIANYMQSIHQTLQNAQIKLKTNGIIPNRILLSGGACRMPFIREYAKQIFHVDVDVDQQPECVVSNGIALYAQKFDEAFHDLLNSLGKINFESIYKKADTDATADAIRELVPSVVSEVKNYSGCTGNRMRTMFCDFIKGLDESNTKFKDLVLYKLKSTLNSAARQAITSAYNNVFNLEVNTSDVNINVQANILSFYQESFKPGGGWYNNFTIWIASSSGRYDFTWDKPRDYSERCKIADGVKSYLTSYVSSMNITYPNLDSLVEDIVKQVVKYTIEIFKKKQLFDMTFRQ